MGPDGAARGAGGPLWGRAGGETPGGPPLHQGGRSGAHCGAPHPLREGRSPGEALCRPDKAGRSKRLFRDRPHQEEAPLQNTAKAHHHQCGQEGLKQHVLITN